MVIGNSFFAGVCISIGCVAYMKAGNTFLGALLFSLGLLTVMGSGFYLFTGKTCREEWVKRPIKLMACLFGNLGGCLCASLMFGPIEGIRESAEKIAYGKLMRPDIAVFAGAIFCGMLIAIAVQSGEMVHAMMAVMVFILCGGEHIVADAFYFIAGGVFDLKFFLIVFFGNLIGGLLFLKREETEDVMEKAGKECKGCGNCSGCKEE